MLYVITYKEFSRRYNLLPIIFKHLNKNSNRLIPGRHLYVAIVQQFATILIVVTDTE